MNLGAESYSQDELHAAGFKAIGKNVSISTRASLYGVSNICIGDNVRIDDFATLIATNNILEIGSNVTIHNYCFLGARAKIYLHDFVTLAPGVKLFSCSDDYSGEYLTGSTVPAEYTGGISGMIVIKKHSILGANTIVLPNLIIETGTSVGANSLVKESTKAWTIYAGSPVKEIAVRSMNILDLEAKYKKAGYYE